MVTDLLQGLTKKEVSFKPTIEEWTLLRSSICFGETETRCKAALPAIDSPSINSSSLPRRESSRESSREPRASCERMCDMSMAASIAPPDCAVKTNRSLVKDPAPRSGEAHEVWARNRRTRRRLCYCSSPRLALSSPSGERGSENSSKYQKFPKIDEKCRGSSLGLALSNVSGDGGKNGECHVIAGTRM